jgi:hypothetical protein
MTKTRVFRNVRSRRNRSKKNRIFMKGGEDWTPITKDEFDSAPYRTQMNSGISKISLLIDQPVHIYVGSGDNKKLVSGFFKHDNGLGSSIIRVLNDDGVDEYLQGPTNSIMKTPPIENWLNVTDRHDERLPGVGKVDKLNPDDTYEIRYYMANPQVKILVNGDLLDGEVLNIRRTGREGLGHEFQVLMCEVKVGKKIYLGPLFAVDPDRNIERYLLQMIPPSLRTAARNFLKPPSKGGKN